jgi:hypothetical protein
VYRTIISREKEWPLMAKGEQPLYNLLVQKEVRTYVFGWMVDQYWRTFCIILERSSKETILEYIRRNKITPVDTTGMEVLSDL